MLECIPLAYESAISFAHGIKGNGEGAISAADGGDDIEGELLLIP